MTSAALLGTTLIAMGPAQASTGNSCANWDIAEAAGRLLLRHRRFEPPAPRTYGSYHFVGLSFHPALYNEREVVRFYNKKNVNYQTFLEPANRGWRFGSQNWKTDIHGAVRPGRVGGSLQGDGKVLATVCVGIS